MKKEKNFFFFPKDVIKCSLTSIHYGSDDDLSNTVESRHQDESPKQSMVQPLKKNKFFFFF